MTKQSVLWGMDGRIQCRGGPAWLCGAGADAGRKISLCRLGGKPSISTVIDQFVVNMATDTRINGQFATTDIHKLKGHLVDQICMATGGPCTYSGRDMKTTHAGMKICNGDIGALVGDLVKALDTFKVPTHEKEELLGLFGPMRKDIVEVP